MPPSKPWSPPSYATPLQDNSTNNTWKPPVYAVPHEEQTATKPTDEPDIFSLVDKFSNAIKNHPAISRFATGEDSPELAKAKKDAGVTQTLGPGLTEIPGVRKGFDSLADTIDNPKGEGGYLQGFLAGALHGVGNLLSTGADPRSVTVGKGIRDSLSPPDVGVTDLGSVRPEQKLLTGKRFYAPESAPDKTLDINTTLPVRSTEKPYRAPDSFNTSEGDTQGATEAFNEYLNKKQQVAPEEQKLLTSGEPEPEIHNNQLQPYDRNDMLDALSVKNEFEPWKGVRNIKEGLGRLGAGFLGRDSDQSSGPIDWGPQSSNNTELDKPTDKNPTAVFKGFQEDGSGGAFPLYDIQGGSSHGSTVDAQHLQKLGIDVPETPKNPHKESNILSDEPSFARTETGGIKIGVNIAKAAGELTSGYSNPLEGVMVREGLQNAIDATRHLGKDAVVKAKILQDTADTGERNGIEISDNGKGMTKQQLETVFSDLHSSGKVGEANATGGKGIGKATYMLGGQHFSAETVVFENGKKIKRTIEGTPDQFMEDVPIKEEEVPWQTPTGTTIRTIFKPEQERYNAIDMLGKVIEHSRGVKGKILSNSYGFEKSNPFHSGEGDQEIGKRNIDGSDVTVAVPAGTKLAPSGSITLYVLNNGMYQFRMHHYLVEETPNMPDKLIIDVHPHSEEGTSEYPFPTQRESLKDDVVKKVKDFINEKLVSPEQRGKKNKTQELYDSMTLVHTPGATRRTAIYDPGNRLSPEELRSFQSSPIVENIMSLYDRVIGDILGRVNQSEWSQRLEGVGMVLSPEMHGVHIPNPTTGKSVILINPFEHINSKSPVDTALESIITALHEVAHIGTEDKFSGLALDPEELNDPRVGRYLQSYISHVQEQGGLDMAHGVGFIKRLGEVYSKYGARRAFEEADELQSILTDDSGEYNPEVQRLLHIYKESRGRAATTEDFLSRTGIKQKAGKPSGKGNVPSGDNSDGKGTSPTKVAINKLLKALEETRDLRGEQEEINRKTRAERFAASAGVKTEGMKGAAQSLGKMSGEFDKVEAPDHLKMSQKELDSLFTEIKRSNITQAEKLRGYTSLFKLINGDGIPVRSELKVLDDVFGNGFAERVIQMHGGLGSVGIQIGKTANTMKALMSSIDLSAPLRQGIGMVHRPEYRDAFKEMFKYLGSQEAYDASMKAIEQRPSYLLGREAGLFLAKPDNLLSGEESFLNNYAHMIPGVNKLVNMSERAYTGFLNKLRADIFDNLVKQAKIGGSEAFTVAESKNEDGTVTKSIVPTDVTKNIAKYINIATGRGNLGTYEKMAAELNTVIWSPRLLKSRLDMLNPKYYADLDPFTRKEAIKSLLAVAAFGTTVAGLGVALGGKTSLNPLSADFGKARFGNKVLDPWAGFQQPIVAAARFITGSNEVGPQNRWDTFDRFRQSKDSPIAGLVEELMRAKVFNTKTDPGSLIPPKVPGQGGFQDQYGNQKYLSREVASRYVPIFTQDLSDLLTDNPSLAETLGLGTASLFGMGTQNYAERATNKKMTMPRRPSLRF